MSTALQIRGLTKVYGNGFEALKGIDLDVAEGDFFALLGPNGAGKSTIIGILSSLVRKSGGAVRIFDKDIDVDFPGAKRYLGVVPQEFNFSQFEKVFDIVCNQAGFYGLTRSLARQRAEHYLQQLGLWDKRDQPSRNLSGGMKRRLMIARALVHEPRLLILDEPTAGVDIELRRSMWEFLREINRQGTTIILTTHYLEEAESLCRNIGIIDHGRLIEHTSTRELLARLQQEHFILDLRDEIAPDVDLSAIDGRRIDGHTLEVEIERGDSINEIFLQLSERGIQVASMRNKSNRLEELFVSLLARNNGEASAKQEAQQ